MATVYANLSDDKITQYYLNESEDDARPPVDGATQRSKTFYESNNLGDIAEMRARPDDFWMGSDLIIHDAANGDAAVDVTGAGSGYEKIRAAVRADINLMLHDGDYVGTMTTADIQHMLFYIVIQCIKAGVIKVSDVGNYGAVIDPTT